MWYSEFKLLLCFRVFGLLSSSLLFPQRFDQYVLWPSSGVWRTQEPTWNFELHPLLNPQGSPVLISLVITGYKVSNNTGILNTCTRLWLMESEQATPMDSIKFKVPCRFQNLTNTWRRPEDILAETLCE